MPKKFLIILIFLVILSVGLGFRIYYGQQKASYHLDEYLSLNISTYNSTAWINDEQFIPFLENSALNPIMGQDILNFLFPNKENPLKNYIDDVKVLINFTRDSPHPNLYYVLLRTSLIPFKTFDAIFLENNFKNSGLAINLMLYIIGTVFLYKLFKLLYDYKIALLVCLCYALLASAISLSIFIRPYELFSSALIISTYLIIKLLKSKEKNLIEYIQLSFSLGLLYLSHYYSFIFLFFWALVILYHYGFRQKKYKIVMHYALAFMQGILYAQAFYTYYLLGFLASDRTKEALDNAQAFSLDYFMDRMQWTFNLFNYIGHLSLALFLILGVLFLYFTMLDRKEKQLEKKDKVIIKKYHSKGLFTLEEIYVLGVSLSFIVLVMALAPFESIRYIGPVFIFLFIIPVHFIKKSINKLFVFGALLVIYLGWNALIKVDAYPNIEYAFNQNAEKKVYIGSIPDGHMWEMMYFIYNINKEQNYFYLKNTLESIKQENLEDSILILWDSHPQFKELEDHIFSKYIRTEFRKQAFFKEYNIKN